VVADFVFIDRLSAEIATLEQAIAEFEREGSRLQRLAQDMRDVHQQLTAILQAHVARERQGGSHS
jgi:hypothetical protein